MIAIQMDHYVLCEVRGLTVNQAADCLGILPSSARSAAARYGLKFAETNNQRNRKPVTHEGIEYPSRAALAKAKGQPDRIGANDGQRICHPRTKVSASPDAIRRYTERAK